MIGWYFQEPRRRDLHAKRTKADGQYARRQTEQDGLGAAGDRRRPGTVPLEPESPGDPEAIQQGAPQVVRGETRLRNTERLGQSEPVTSRKLEIIAEPGKPNFTTRRVVDAPRALVFDAFTKPEHLKRWMGPRTFPMVTCENDVRVGGRYRFVHRAPDGQEFGFHGEYREVVRPERIVRTFVFEPMPDHEALETLTLEESGGKTTITTTTLHRTPEGRDGHLASGRMEAGMTEGYERLDELLATLQKH